MAKATVNGNVLIFPVLAVLFGIFRQAEWGQVLFVHISKQIHDYFLNLWHLRHL